VFYNITGGDVTVVIDAIESRKGLRNVTDGRP